MQTTSDVAIEVIQVSKGFSTNRGIRGVLSAHPRLARFFSAENRKQILNDVSFKIPAGKVFGIVGYNGSGKSTLMQIISGLMIPDGGEVKVFGKAPEKAKGISTANPRELYEGFTVVDQLTFIAKLNQLDAEQALEQAISLLAFLIVKEADYAQTFQDELSLGTKGKVALVVGLLPLLGADREPTGILLLDEPTLGFDPFARSEFFEAFGAFRSLFPNVTIVIGTNDPQEAAICDTTISLNKGVANTSIKAHETLQLVSGQMEQHSHSLKCIIDPERANEVVNGVARLTLKSIPIKPSSALSIFTFRFVVDLKNNVETLVLLVLQLVLPNLLVFFSMVQERGFKYSFFVWVLGIHMTMLLRESMRFHDRERGYFKMLQTIWLSPISREEHLTASTILQWSSQTFYTAAASIVMLLLTWNSWNLEHLVTPLCNAWCLESLLVAIGMMIAIHAIGLLTTYVPLALTSIQSFFFQNMVPFFGILCSGIYYDSAQLPLPLRLVSECNPLSYGAYAYRELLGIGSNSEPFMVSQCKAFGVSASEGSIAAVIQLVLAICLLIAARWIAPQLEMMMRRAGRFHV